MFSTDNNLAAYREVFNDVIDDYITQEIYALFNGVLLFDDDYDAYDIINLFKDEQVMNNAIEAFGDYVFDEINEFEDISFF